MGKGGRSAGALLQSIRSTGLPSRPAAAGARRPGDPLPRAASNYNVQLRRELGLSPRSVHPKNLPGLPRASRADMLIIRD